MALEPFASREDLADRWRPLTSAELTPAETLLGSASRLVRSRVPDVDDRIAALTLDPDLVADVVCEIVRRALTVRLTGAESSSVAVGGVSQSFTYTNPQSNLYITGDELARLSVLGGRRAFSISTLPAGYTLPVC